MRLWPVVVTNADSEAETGLGVWRRWPGHPLTTTGSVLGPGGREQSAGEGTSDCFFEKREELWKSKTGCGEVGTGGWSALPRSKLSMPGITKPSSSKERVKHPAAACLRIELRPKGLERRTAKGDRARPIVPKRLWNDIPGWISLHAERGAKKRCTPPPHPGIPWAIASSRSRVRTPPRCCCRRNPRCAPGQNLPLSHLPPPCLARSDGAGAGMAARYCPRRTTAVGTAAARSEDAIRSRARVHPSTRA